MAKSNQPEVINGVEYQLVKELKSQTRVRAWHVICDKNNYQINVAFIPRLCMQVSVYDASEKGQAIDLSKPLIKFNGDNWEDGRDALIEMLAAKKNLL